MPDNGWIPFAAAEALAFDGDEAEARKRLLRALRLGQVSSRGVLLPDREVLDDGRLRENFEPEDIPADRWSDWEFLPIYQGSLSAKMRRLQWLVPAGAVLSRVCRGYADVRLSRSDVDRLTGKGAASERGVNLAPEPGVGSAAPAPNGSEAAGAGSPVEIGDGGLSETARSLARSYFDEPRWPLRHALNWIACRKIEALLLMPEELRSLRGRAVLYGADTSLVSKNPARELLTALKADKLRAIGPDHKELPPEFWDDKHVEVSIWPEVRFRRDDMTRVWPAIEPLVRDSLEESARVPEAKPVVHQPRMNDADMERKLPSFLKQLQREWELQGRRFNQTSAREEAEAHFGKAIDRSRFRSAYRSVGLNQKGGRPRKTPPKS
jgi:hypothetical protein